MTAMIRRLLRVSFAAIALMFITGSAYAQSPGASHHAPGPLFVPAIALIGAGAYLAYRRSRPTD